MFTDRHYGTFANCPECGGPIDIEYDTYDEEDYETDEEKKYGIPGGITAPSETR